MIRFAKNFIYQIMQERELRYLTHKQHVILVPSRGGKKERLNKRINSKSDPYLIRLY